MNIREIAKLAGVSVASVSRVLNGVEGKVSAATRARVLEICAANHFTPNGHMLRLARGRADTVAFLFPSGVYGGNGKMDENLAAAILGAQEELASSSTFLTLAALSDSFLEAKEYLRFHRDKTVDGMLVWGWKPPGDYLSELIEEGVPLVMLQGVAEGVPVCSVTPQDAEGMKMLVDHVVSRGHRHVALMPFWQATSIGRERQQGVLKALRGHGLEPSWISSEQGSLRKDGSLACKEILPHAPETTCVMAGNDLAALGVIAAAKELGLSVPGDLSVTGADGLELHGQLALTTYAAQSYAIGREAARLLRKVIDNPGMAPERIRVPVEFIPGATVAKLL